MRFIFIFEWHLNLTSLLLTTSIRCFWQAINIAIWMRNQFHDNKNRWNFLILFYVSRFTHEIILHPNFNARATYSQSVNIIDISFLNEWICHKMMQHWCECSWLFFIIFYLVFHQKHKSCHNAQDFIQDERITMF